MNQATQQRTTIWPAAYLLGTTDNLASNETIIAGLSARATQAQLNNTARQPTYYNNVADIYFHDGPGSLLSMNVRFRSTIFGFPIEAQIIEYVPLADDQAARVAWHGWAEDDATTHLDAIHVWLFEDLPGGRIRILTQEPQIGVPVQELTRTLPSPMINGHQEWITDLARVAHDV